MISNRCFDMQQLRFARTTKEEKSELKIQSFESNANGSHPFT